MKSSRPAPPAAAPRSRNGRELWARTPKMNPAPRTSETNEPSCPKQSGAPHRRGDPTHSVFCKKGDEWLVEEGDLLSCKHILKYAAKGPHSGSDYSQPDSEEKAVCPSPVETADEEGNPAPIAAQFWGHGDIIHAEKPDATRRGELWASREDIEHVHLTEMPPPRRAASHTRVASTNISFAGCEWL